MELFCSYLDYSIINYTDSLLNTPQYAKVIFYDIKEKYILNKDLVCKYSATDDFATNSSDRIVLFRLGWQTVTEYEAFEWAPSTFITESAEEKQLNVYSVKFPGDSLPTDTNEFYQLCYMNKDNIVYGASIPFQFISCPATRSSNDVCNLSNADSLSQLQNDNKCLRQELLETQLSVTECHKQLDDLRLEIKQLKHALLSKTTQSDANNLYNVIPNISNETKEQDTNIDVDVQLACLGELEPLPPFPLLL